MSDMDVDDVSPGLPKRTESLLREQSTWAEPPAGFEDSLLAGLRRERDATPVLPSPRRSRSRWLTGRQLLAAAAAVVLVVAGTAIGIHALSDDNPNAQHVALAGTPLAPAAHGEAEIVSTPSGFKITLDTEGLAPAPAGTYYQAWLKSADGDLVTIGTFHARGGGQAIILWSGVDPGDYALLTVTLQRVGEGADSSGQVVLAGPLP
jgi:Anti-sigma-K factor rskA